MQWLTERLSHIWRVYRSWLMAIVGGVYAVLGIATFVSDNFIAPRMRASLDTFALIPHWSGSIWGLVALGILLLGSLEGSFRVDRERQREMAGVQQQLAALLDLAPTILSARALPLSDRRLGNHGEFDVFLEILVKEPTAFADGWRVDLSWENGIRATNIPGRPPLQHAYQFGRHGIRVAFPYTEIGDDSVLNNARVERISAVDHRGRTVSYVRPAALTAATT